MNVWTRLGRQRDLAASRAGRLIEMQLSHIMPARFVGIVPRIAHSEIITNATHSIATCPPKSLQAKTIDLPACAGFDILADRV